MSGIARFALVRSLVVWVKKLLSGRRCVQYLSVCESRRLQTFFPEVDQAAFVQTLSTEGLAFGLKLPAEAVASIHDYARRFPCYADREEGKGFLLDDREHAEFLLGKPMLIAQYFNTIDNCAEIRRLAQDPVLQSIACAFLKSEPKFVGANLWWTFPVDALAADRERHAHLFHRDVDDFRFFKFFFYLTDVGPEDGAHVCVKASHLRPPVFRTGDRWNIRRYTDQEIAGAYDRDLVKEICGPAGTGFGENTLCVHKGLTPTRSPRLLLQLQYALFDYGNMHDRRAPDVLAMLM
jgi:hypothetical protein